MSTNKIIYVRGMDLPIQMFLTDTDTLEEVPLDDVVAAKFYVMINKVQVGKYSLLVESGYEEALPGEDTNEIVIPIKGDDNLDWPIGKITIRAEVTLTDLLYPSGREYVELLDVGTLE